MSKKDNLRPVKQGEPYTRAVEGGFIKDKAPVDGIEIDEPGFVPAGEVEAALAKLGRWPSILAIPAKRRKTGES